MEKCTNCGLDSNTNICNECSKDMPGIGLTQFKIELNEDSFIMGVDPYDDGKESYGNCIVYKMSEIMEHYISNLSDEEYLFLFGKDAKEKRP